MEKFSEKRRLGNLGEDLAMCFLTKLGYQILERNYLKKWGELDIIAKQSEIVHFCEVKSVSREKADNNQSAIVSHSVSRDCFTEIDFRIEVSRETNEDEYLPEENVHFWKQKRMIRAIQTYLLERNVNADQEWQIDILTVKIDFSRKIAIIKHIENVVFDVPVA